MMLNPKKCVFGVSSGKLLGYMVSSWGIDANPKKVEAIKNLQPPRTRKEMSHPVLRPKPDAHRMYAQDQVVKHTARM
jgi:hypothetical protein